MSFWGVDNEPFKSLKVNGIHPSEYNHQDDDEGDASSADELKLPVAFTCELCPTQDEEKAILEQHLKYHRRVPDHIYKHIAGMESSATDTDGESSSSTPTLKRKSKRRHEDVVECEECDFRGKIEEVS